MSCSLAVYSLLERCFPSFFKIQVCLQSNFFGVDVDLCAELTYQVMVVMLARKTSSKYAEERMGNSIVGAD